MKKVILAAALFLAGTAALAAGPTPAFKLKAYGHDILLDGSAGDVFASDVDKVALTDGGMCFTGDINAA